MGAFDPVITYEKGTYIGEFIIAQYRHWLIFITLTETDTGSRSLREVYAVLNLTIVADKVSRKAVITGATNIILGGKSIVHAGASHLFCLVEVHFLRS